MVINHIKIGPEVSTTLKIGHISFNTSFKGKRRSLALYFASYSKFPPKWVGKNLEKVTKPSKTKR